MPAKKPYHRENLRRDLLDAGREYVRQHGHHGLSIRTLAQQVGVSPGAPYHHFPDRRSLLLALAIEGFEEMHDGAEQV
ncbi:MAG: TetR/AcrR family transcriptional regulator, partial [Novosphingobium sp.]